MKTNKAQEAINTLLEDIKKQKESIKKCAYYDSDDVIRMLDALTKRLVKIQQSIQEEVDG